MPHKRLVTVRRRLWLASMAIGLAVVGAVPASSAQTPRVPGPGKWAGTGIEEERPADRKPGSDPGISVAVPIGRVSAGPDFADGEPIYVRRMTGKEGMTVVEVSTTPFMPVLSSNQGHGPRPDQPVSW